MLCILKMLNILSVYLWLYVTINHILFSAFFSLCVLVFVSCILFVWYSALLMVVSVFFNFTKITVLPLPMFTTTPLGWIWGFTSNFFSLSYALILGEGVGSSLLTNISIVQLRNLRQFRNLSFASLGGNLPSFAIFVVPHLVDP